MLRLFFNILFGGCCLFFSSITCANLQDVKSDFFYLGVEGGLVEPVQSKFRHKNADNSHTSITLKRSSMYSAKVGYSFYPQMALEFSATHQPKYRLGYTLPEQNLAEGVVIPKTPGTTRVISNIYMLNLIYDLQKVNGLTPFVIAGAGVANVKIKSTSSRAELLNSEYFIIKKNSTNCLAWQMGVGVSKEIAANFSIDATVKLQVAHNIKIKYDTLDPGTQKFLPAKPIKKTIGVGEFGIGFTYRL